MSTDKHVLEELRSYKPPTQKSILDRIKEDLLSKGLENRKGGYYLAESCIIGETVVNFLKSNCNYGGFRYWYECPVCHKRAYKLYRVGGYRCRKCFPSIYEKQTHSHRQRSNFYFLDKLFISDDLEGKRLVYKGKPTKWGRKKLALPALLS